MVNEENKLVQQDSPLQTPPCPIPGGSINKWHPEKLEALEACLQEYAPR